MVEPTNKKRALMVCTGRMCSGKDHIALSAGYTCVSIAEPLYRLASYYIGSDNKKDPNVRSFLQVLGAWGRGEATEAKTLGGKNRTELLSELIEKGAGITGLTEVNWREIGQKRSFWLAAAASAAAKLACEGEKVAITNARFKEELDALTQLGFKHVHVLCSEEERIKRAGRSYSAKIDEDITEKMAIDINSDILKNGTRGMSGTTFIWSENTPPPVEGIITVQKFVQEESCTLSQGLRRGQTGELSLQERVSLGK